MEEIKKTSKEELLELIKALEIIGCEVGEAIGDGEVELSDLKHLIDLVKKYRVILDGFQGLSEIEVKDIVEADVAQAIFEMIKTVLAKFSAARAEKEQEEAK